MDNSVLLGREVLTIPGIGEVENGLIGHSGMVIGIGATIIVLCYIPWERIVGRKDKRCEEIGE